MTADTAEQIRQMDEEQVLSMYRRMLFYRRFEERVNMAYTKQKFSGFCHLHIGQEAVCVGLGSCTRPDDLIISGYRSHTQAIEKGIPPGEVFAELLGKVTGCARGKGGSMHMFSQQHGFYGGHGIVGGQAPIAVGAAFALKYQNLDSNMVCYLGDAAMNQGQVYEAMNMAATWELPVLFVIENNRYGMGTDIRRTTSIESLYKRALAFDMASSQVDGMNVIQVYQHSRPIMEQMRKDRKPHLLEALTYRYKGHSVSDPGNYRTKEELQEYQERDPLLTLAAAMKNLNLADDARLKEWDQEARSKAKEAEKFADDSPISDESETWEHVFAEAKTSSVTSC
ncbi:MAG: pyruvate dehydrogenase (acetyl-transferring) E1 component subunit alpha [Deltaproteobacteria bacterium]|nr:pyruvate dehydrogenase (acetyl-transferring) E1 component subunit alpha [Deltaproteobacteria bacterium]